MAQINYIADSTFRPYSFQERLAPYLLYKDAYDKAEASYEELRKKAGVYKYLADATADDPEARAIYEGYANDLAAQVQDFSKNGLTIANKKALSSLRGRYWEEIGVLDAANTAMQEEKKRRLALESKDNSMMYATNNLKLSDFLPGRNPNLYGVSGDDLRKEGALYAQSASARMYSDPSIENINKYYQGIVQTVGYSPEVMTKWQSDLESISVFNKAVDDILSARGVDANLSDADYERAKQSVINGIMEGAVYKQSMDVKQNPGVLTRDQELDNARMQRSLMFQEEKSGLKWNPDTRSYERNDPNEWMYTHEDESQPNTSRRTGYNRNAIPKGYTINPSNGHLIKDTTNQSGNNLGGEDTSTKSAQKVVANGGITSTGTVITHTNEGYGTINLPTTGKNYPPFTVDAFDANAGFGFDVTGIGDFSNGDAKEYDIENLRSEQARDQIRNYVRGILPGVLDDMDNEQVDKVVKLMEFKRDYDFFSDNTFRLSVPGTDNTGRVTKKTAFDKFISDINKIKIEAYRAQNDRMQQPVESQAGTTTSADSTNFTMDEGELNERTNTLGF